MLNLKKCFLGLLCASLMFACLPIVACHNDTDENAIVLVAVDANSVGMLPDVDYYVVPEPAASAKVKAISDLKFVGDLQSLYGDDGYPQAVIVAKNQLFGTKTLAEFSNVISDCGEWLLSDTTQISEIVNVIQGKLTNGLEPSIKVQNLTKAVIKNCGVRYVKASESKTQILSFMQKLNEVSQSSFGIPVDKFFMDCEDGGFEYNKKISIYAPDGAPALGLVKLMAQNFPLNAQYEIVNPTIVQTLVSGSAPKADICVLPVSTAVKLLCNANGYKLFATLTHGNLYILSKYDKDITKSNLSELRGKRVGVVNLAAVPGLTFKLILKSQKLDYVEKI